MARRTLSAMRFQISIWPNSITPRICFSLIVAPLIWNPLLVFRPLVVVSADRAFLVERCFLGGGHCCRGGVIFVTLTARILGCRMLSRRIASLMRILFSFVTWQDLNVADKWDEFHVRWIVKEHSLGNRGQRIRKFSQLVISVRKTAVLFKFARTKLLEVPTNLRLVVAMDSAYVVLARIRFWHRLFSKEGKFRGD